MSKTYDVAVRKNFPLAKGETINQAMENLRRIGRDHVKKALGVGEKGGAYLTEAFSNAAVFSVYKDGDSDRYYAAAFKRDADGEYEFGALQEVKRVTGFRPIAKPAPSLIKKSADGAPSEEFAGLEGWPVVKKGLFHGVI